MPQNEVFDFVVFIGRFQPFHRGHQAVVDQALRRARRGVLILAGSARQPRSIKNPWTFEERKTMILSSARSENIEVLPLEDRLYNDQQWAGQVQALVAGRLLAAGWSDKPYTVALIGHSKDESSYYLKLFPQWTQIDHPMDEAVNATDIRRLYLEGQSAAYLKEVVSDTILQYMATFGETPHYKALTSEFTFINDYRKQWAGAPYPPTFLTVDAAVIQSGHILLIQRRSHPGKGQWALPGGFVDANESCLEAMLRELREETRLKVPAPVLQGSIKDSRLFDHPERSLRGRTVTEAFLMELKPGPLPPVKGGDDAKAAFWLPISDLDPARMFEDHYHIIQYFLGRI